jgi:elongation factor P hydroxylase
MIKMVEQMIARRAVAVQQALQSYFDTVLHSPSQLNGSP